MIDNINADLVLGPTGVKAEDFVHPPKHPDANYRQPTGEMTVVEDTDAAGNKWRYRVTGAITKAGAEPGGKFSSSIHSYLKKGKVAPEALKLVVSEKVDSSGQVRVRFNGVLAEASGQ